MLQRNCFPVMLRNRLILAGLELVLSHTEKNHVSYPILDNFLQIIKLEKNHDISTSFVSAGLGTLGSNKTGINLLILINQRKAVYNTNNFLQFDGYLAS